MLMLLSIALLSFGFYLLYHTSRKAVFKRSVLSYWLQSHAVITKPMGIILIIFSCLILIKDLGLGAGIFYTLTALMTISSLIVVLMPLKWRS